MPMRICVLISCFAIFAGGVHADPLRVNGSTTVNPIVSEAAEMLRESEKLEIQVDTQGGSSGGIHALGEGRADMAMSSRALHDEDHKRHAKADFHAHRIGFDAVALVVSKDVWQSGVKSLSQSQMRRIYERKARKWSDFGGPDRRIAFFNKEPGRGTWEVFADWLYGSAAKTPSIAHLEVGSNEETRAKVAGTRGAISQLSASWVDQQKLFALGIKDAEGHIHQPDAKSLASGDYPLGRSLWVITDGPPTGSAKVLIDFLLSDDGQALVKKHGYLALDDHD